MTGKVDPLLLGGLMITFTSAWFAVIFWAGLRHPDLPPSSSRNEAAPEPGGRTVAELAERERLALRLGVVQLPPEVAAVVEHRGRGGWGADSRLGNGPASARELARTGAARQ